MTMSRQPRKRSSVFHSKVVGGEKEGGAMESGFSKGDDLSLVIITSRDSNARELIASKLARLQADGEALEESVGRALPNRCE